MTSGKIDDPWEASRQAWQAERDNEPQEAALGILNLLGPVADVVKAVRERFRSANREGRVEYLFRALDLKFKQIDKKFSSSDSELSKVRERITSSEFHEGAEAAAEEAVRAESRKKIDRFAAVLAGSVEPNQWADAKQDIATMIRDLAQLGDRDIEALSILASVHASAISHMPNLQSPDWFSKETPALKHAIANSGIHPDDFLSTCERLRGFGLAADVLRNTSHMGAEDFCYRPTRRGLLLLECLT